MKLSYIDALRGFAVLGVIMFHSLTFGEIEYFPKIFAGILGNGFHGVQLFFVVSAFTLFLSMDRRHDNEKNPSLNFFVRRFFRIAPMYYIGIIYYLWQNGFVNNYSICGDGIVTTTNVLSNVFFLHGLYPDFINTVVPGGWSIAVEMSFYLLVPFLFLKIKNTKQSFFFLVFTLILRFVLHALLSRYSFECDRVWNSYLFFYLPSQLPVFALGILFYHIVKEGYKLVISPLLLLVTFLLIVGQIIGYSIFPKHILFSISFVVIGLALSKKEFKLIVNPVIIYIGKISYSMYLSHFAVIYWMTKYNYLNFLEGDNLYINLVNYGIRFLIVIVLSVLLSFIMYKIIERPMQKLGKKVITKITHN